VYREELSKLLVKGKGNRWRTKKNRATLKKNQVAQRRS
jgi:hypothetical protein